MKVQLTLGQLAQPIDYVDISVAASLLSCHPVSVIAGLRGTGREIFGD
jgi:hypothetical protein